jgi:plastocyanin
VGTLTATIDLDPGETITCTYTNGKGSVTIVKDAVPNDAQDFSFSGTCFGNFSLDDDADPALSNTRSGNISVGICTVTEEALAAGWTLTSLACTDPDNGTTVNLATQTATIDVDPGESITCTFTNDGVGTVVINKQCDPAGDPQLFTFTRSYGANVNIGCSGSNTTTLSLGTYSVLETVPAGWDLISATCSDGSLPGAISLQAGETVTCTFTNQKDAVIIVCKETDPNADPQSFTFTPSYTAAFSLTDGQCINSGDLDPGTYSVSEAAVPGWVLSSSPCTDGSNGQHRPSAGETVTCTFNNTKTGSITIVKDAAPDGTQGFFFTCSAPIGPFTLDDDGTNANPFDSSKTTSDLLPGTYSCSEALPAGWVSTSATCSDGSSPASISLSAGENVTCTFVNTKLASITIIKDAVPNSPQDFSFTCLLRSVVSAG